MLKAALAWDLAARTWIVAHRIHALDRFMWLLSVVGRGGMIWLAVAAIVSWRRRRPRELLIVGLALLAATLMADHVLKPAIHRTRPFIMVPDVPVIGGPPQDASFPSGHAANAFAGALVLSSVVPEGTAAWWSTAVAIAYSRVYLGVHYPLDVLCGALVGVACAALVLWGAGRRRR